MGQNIYGGGGLTSGNIMTGGGQQAVNWRDLAQANLGVGQQLGNQAMQGNQWIGQMGLTGAQQAGNAYMQGAQGMAGGILGQGNLMAQGLGSAFGQLGGGMMSNYWNTGSPWGARQVGGAPSSFLQGAIPGYDPTLGMA
jgi:hypothetical protein